MRFTQLPGGFISIRSHQRIQRAASGASQLRADSAKDRQAGTDPQSRCPL